MHARPPERIDFPAGATSGSVRGVVTGSESREYLFRAQAGQKMKLGVSSKRAKWLVVQVPAPDRTALAQRGEVSLPASGDYLLRLSIRSPEARRGERVEYQARLTILPLEAVDADTVPAGQAKTGAYRQGVAFEGGKPADGLTVSRLDLSPQPDCERLVVRFENGPRPGRFKVEPHPQGGGWMLPCSGCADSRPPSRNRHPGRPWTGSRCFPTRMTAAASSASTRAARSLSKFTSWPTRPAW